jgi:hypothetical protein
MALQLINIGNVADDGTGDSLRVAFQKINSNTTELISIVGTTGSVTAVPNTTVVRDSNADIYVNKAFFKNLFPTLAGLPSAVDRGGMIVYVVNNGAYISNNVAWKKLPIWNSNTVVTDAVLRWNGGEFVTTDSGVKSFNGQTGDIALTANDINTAMGSKVLTDAGGRIAIDANGNITFGTAASLGVTGFIKMPVGTSSQRPPLPVLGMLRYNSDLDVFEGYIGPNVSSAWRSIGPLGSSSAEFTNITVTGVAAVNSLVVSNGMNGALGTVTPAAATVTTFTSSGLATFSNTVTLTSNTTANALGTGALVIAGTGGASVGGNLFVGGALSVDELTITGTKQSTAPTNGALTVAGGAGIGKNLNVGGNSVITGNFSAVNTQINSYAARSISTLGVPNQGTHQGYLLLAKAYVSGLQPVSYVTGDFVFKRGSDSSNNRTDIYRVMSSSGYSSEDLTVQVQSGLSFFVKTVKVNYTGVIYHAIVTTATGGEPDNGILFYGSAVNAGLIYVDATYVTVTAPSFGSYTHFNSNGDFTVSGIITNNYIEYTSGVKSPRPADIKSNSIHGFNSYGSTDFPGAYYTGWTVKGATVGAQLAVSWNTEEDGTKTNVFVRANDDTTDPTEWSTWEQVLTKNGNYILPTAQGGTGLGGTTPFTQYGIMYASTTTALATGSDLTFDPATKAMVCKGNITGYSDSRLKKNIKVIDSALEKVNQLHGYTFDRIDIDNTRQTGVIAQEVLKVLPEAVSENADGIYSVAYGNMVGLLIESIKELTQQVADLKSQLQAVKK